MEERLCALIILNKGIKIMNPSLLQDLYFRAEMMQNPSVRKPCLKLKERKK